MNPIIKCPCYDKDTRMRPNDYKRALTFHDVKLCKIDLRMLEPLVADVH